MSTQSPGPLPAGRRGGGWVMQLVPFAILLAVGLYLRLHWDEIPPRFPVHWEIDGRPNGWSIRTPMGVCWPLLFGAAILAVAAVSSYAARHFASAARFDARIVEIFLLLLEFFLAFIFSFVALLPLTGDAGVTAVLVATTAFLVALIALIVWSTKRSLQNASAPASRSAVSDAPNDYWKAGLFYYNPDDAALFVPKRIGFGYTLNFAHPSAWICLGAILFPIAILLLVLHQR